MLLLVVLAHPLLCCRDQQGCILGSDGALVAVPVSAFVLVAAF